MRWVMVLLVATFAVPAAAASVSDFDGTYNGSLALKPGLDGAGCSAYDVKSVHVEKGQIQSGSGSPSFSGSINPAGDVDGHMNKGDGGDVSFSGRAGMNEYENKLHINASIVDDKKGCGWALSLEHE